MHRFLLSILVTVLAGCASHRPAPVTLYADLGGQPGIERITDALIQRFARDPLVAPSFARTQIPRFRSLFVTYLCHLTGGPCVYEGDSMADVHGGMNIQENQFNAVVEDLQGAMTDSGVPTRTQNRLLALLAPMRSQVIYK